MNIPLIERDVRVAIIGYGRWGRQCHVHLIERAPGLKLHGIASGSAEKRAQIEQAHGCRAYESFEQVLADGEVDLVVLATPNDTHAPYSIAAMQAGKHVVTDKVMCLSMDEFKRMATCARENNALLSVFQNRRLDGDFRTLQKAMSDGTLGSVKWVEMAWQGFGSWGGWRGERAKGGGRFYDLGAHLIDQTQLLFPRPVESVFCRLQYDIPGQAVESESLTVITFEGGATGVIDLSSLTAYSKPRFLAHGDKGTFQKHGLDPQEDALKAGDIELAYGPQAPEKPEERARVKGKGEEQVLETVPGRWRDYYENIAQVLQQGATPIVTLESAGRTMGIIDAALRSAQTGQVVRETIASAP
jgi:scyllo-inositol 2-dehydrogenase (NADP+)